MTLVVLAIGVLAPVAAIAVLVWDRRGWLDRRTGRRMIVHTTDDQSIEGTLLHVGRDGLVFVVNRLDYVNADANCRIRVMQASINDTRIAVVNKLIALKQGGCKVWVSVENIQPDALVAFKAAGIPVRKSPVHDKLFLISAKYADSADYRTVVLTGSHNLSLSALRHNDELLIKVTDSQAMYDAFYDHFNDA